MSRWDISDPDRVHSSETRAPKSEPSTQPDGASPSLGRGSSSESSSDDVERKERTPEPAVLRTQERRARHQDRGRTYLLRSSEMEAMIDMGRFRTIDVRDLARFVYRGDASHMKQDLRSLRRQGLIEEKTVFRAHKPARKVVTLTDQGHRVVSKASVLGKGQRAYHGFVKPKELDHDVDLYKVYHKAVQEIQEKGGKPLRVRLDFELKESHQPSERGCRTAVRRGASEASQRRCPREWFGHQRHNHPPSRTFRWSTKRAKGRSREKTSSCFRRTIEKRGFEAKLARVSRYTREAAMRLAFAELLAIRASFGRFCPYEPDNISTRRIAPSWLQPA